MSFLTQVREFAAVLENSLVKTERNSSCGGLAAGETRCSDDLPG
jgi:hypothetical protein